MTDVSTSPTTHPAANPATYHSIAGASFPIGTVVRPAGAGVLPSDDGGGLDAAAVTGFAAGAGVEGGSVPVQYAGPLSLTAAQWDAVTGQTGGLTTGASYFASGSLGQIRTTPGFNFETRVGIALSPTDMFVQIDAPRE